MHVWFWGLLQAFYKLSEWHTLLGNMDMLMYGQSESLPIIAEFLLYQRELLQEAAEYMVE